MKNTTNRVLAFFLVMALITLVAILYFGMDPDEIHKKKSAPAAVEAKAETAAPTQQVEKPTDVTPKTGVTIVTGTVSGTMEKD